MTGDAVVMADFSATQAAEIAFRVIRAGAVFRIGFLMIDPAHFVFAVQAIPRTGFDGVDD